MHAKLRAPLVTPFQVPRRQINDRIAAEGSTRLVLIHGPAGFGKTTAMLQLRDFYQQAGAVTTWLTLDDADNEVQRFLFFFSQALGQLRAAGKGAADADDAEGTGDVALRLIDSIAAWPDPFAIFLDDFEAIGNPVVLGLVTRIIESVPEHGHVVIGSRNVPAIALGRLRAKGCLTEIDSALLRFSVEEAGDFLSRRRGLPLNPDQVRRLHRKTEGWVTPISLASMGLERRADVESFINSFSGSNATITDYLAEDVLARLPDELRDFLLKTGILNELCEPLCDAVRGASNSQAMLQRLERDNMFLIPLDSERKWYRYHSLFAGFLRDQLARQMPEQLGPLHRAAAQWYLSQERPIPAINHALASGDMDYAVALLGQHLNSLLGQGRLRLLGRWFDMLPAQVMASQPYLRIAQAWSVMFTRGARDALKLVEGLDADTLDVESRALLRALRPMLLAMMDDIDEAYEQGIDALSAVPTIYPFSHGMLAQALTNAAIIKGRFAEAHKFADQARRVQEAATGHFNLVLAESAEAIMDLMQGRLRQAAVRLRLVTDPVSAGSFTAHYDNTFTGTLFAETLYEANECEQAQRLLEVYVPLARDIAQPDTLIISHVLLARIVSRQGDQGGDHDRALQLLTELEATGHRLGLARVVASARLERARLALLRNDLRNAKDHLSNAGDPALWQKISRQWFIANDTATLSLGQLRWMIHGGGAAQALPVLKQELEDAELGQRHRRALKIRILMADALHRDGQHKQALRTLTRTLEFAATEGFVQTFLEEGPVVESLLRECAEGQPAGEGGDAASLRREWLARFRAASAPTAIGVAGDLSEALTRKETQVLELLAQGLSNNDMAKKLFVSETTVRTHLRNIFAKLRADNRVQAVAIARRLHLVN